MPIKSNVTLASLHTDDREEFILNNRRTFKYGATEEKAEKQEQSQVCLSFAESRRNSGETHFGLRDDPFEEEVERSSLQYNFQREKF